MTFNREEALSTVTIAGLARSLVIAAGRSGGGGVVPVQRGPLRLWLCGQRPVVAWWCVLRLHVRRWCCRGDGGRRGGGRAPWCWWALGGGSAGAVRCVGAGGRCGPLCAVLWVVLECYAAALGVVTVAAVVTVKA